MVEKALVVIPCLNEARNLPRLLKQAMADQGVDLIVVADGGSTDRSRAIVMEQSRLDKRVILIDNPDRLQSAGINRAVDRYGDNYRWLVRMDAHCHYPDQYVSGLLRTANGRNFSSIVVPMITTGISPFQRAAAAAQNSVIGTGGSAHRHLGQGREVDHGHHALMDIAMYKAVGGYCEAMACNEDSELDYRIARAGGRIWLEPAHAIEYFPRSTPLALWRQYWRYGRGRSRNVKRHGQSLKLRQAVPLLVPAAAAFSPLAVLHPIFLAPIVFWSLLMLMAGLMVGVQQRNLYALVSGVAAMIMHFAWGAGFLYERLFFPSGVPPKHGFVGGRAYTPREEARFPVARARMSKA